MSDERPPSTPSQSDVGVPPAAEDAAVGLTVPRGRSVDKIPRKFGRYRIIDCLGRGGMGAVFRAEDTQLHRTVALKVPFLGDDDADTIQRFYREARSAATLQHAHICPVFDVGEWNGIPYLTMAFIEGKSLAQALEAGATFTYPQIALLIRQLALGMQEAHARGVIHRDLKPSNVLLRPNGEPVIMDFGLARRQDDRAGPGDCLTRQGEIIGTLEYMSPEQVEGDNKAVGPAADIYTLGVILYELLAGRRPFVTGTTTGTLAAILLKPPVPPSEHRPGIPPGLEEICLKAMARKPADRYATMAQFATALAVFLRAPKSGVATPTAKTDAPSTRPPGPITRPVSARTPPPGGTPEPPSGRGESKISVRSGVKGDGKGEGKSAAKSDRRPRSSARKKKAEADGPNKWLMIGGTVAGVVVVGIASSVLLWPAPKADVVESKPPAVNNPPAVVPATKTTPTTKSGTTPTTKGATPTTKGTSPTTKGTTPTTKGTTPTTKGTPAPKTVPVALKVKPDAVALAVGERHEVTVELDRRGSQDPVTVKWDVPPGVRVSPAGPVTLKPGDPNPVLTLRVLEAPAGKDVQVTVTATVTQTPKSSPVTAKVPVTVTPGPCVRVVDIPGTSNAVIDAVAFTPDASVALVGGADTRKGTTDPHAIRSFSLPRGEPLGPLVGHTAKVTKLLVPADGKTVLSVSADDTVALWNLAQASRVSQSPKQQAKVLTAALSPDGKRAMVLYPGLLVKVDVEKFLAYGLPIKTAALTGNGQDDAVRALAASGDRKFLVGGLDGKLFLLESNEKTKPRPLAAHTEVVQAVAFALNNDLAASGGGGVLQVGKIQPGKDHLVCVWDVAAAALKWKAEGHPRPVVAVVFSPDGRLLASGDSGGEVRVWAAADGKPVATLKGHTGPVLALGFAPDGTLWSGAADRALRHWNLP
jgi:serine/threonine protein kinase/WD40 repeat protein